MSWGLRQQSTLNSWGPFEIIIFTCYENPIVRYRLTHFHRHSFGSKNMMADSDIGSANFTITKTIIPSIETNTASVYKTMGRQLFQNFATFDFISIIISINMLSDS